MSDRGGETIDFGAPTVFGAHVFRLEIPPARTDEVLIVEDYGYCGSEDGIPRDEERVVLERRVWAKIADIARREFNDRLKAAKVPTGRWHSGTNLIERLLGRELCVLAWAAERASDAELPVIGSKWAALRAGGALVALHDDSGRGWASGTIIIVAGGVHFTWRFRTARRPRPRNAADVRLRQTS